MFVPSSEHLGDASDRPAIARSVLVSYQDNVIDLEVSRGLKPLLAMLNRADILADPPLPESIR